MTRFDTVVEVLQEFTNSRVLLSAALEKLRIPGQFATLYYDAVRECSETQMRGRQGRKAFIVSCPAVWRIENENSLDTAIEQA